MEPLFCSFSYVVICLKVCQVGKYMFELGILKNMHDVTWGSVYKGNRKTF